MAKTLGKRHKQQRHQKVMVGKVDGEVHAELAKRYEIEEYPTLKIFHGGKAFDYEHEFRTKAAILETMAAHAIGRGAI